MLLLLLLLVVVVLGFVVVVREAREERRGKGPGGGGTSHALADGRAVRMSLHHLPPGRLGDARAPPIAEKQEGGRRRVVEGGWAGEGDEV